MTEPTPLGDYRLCAMREAHDAGWDWMHAHAAPDSTVALGSSPAWRPASEATCGSLALVIARPPKPRKVGYLDLDPRLDCGPHRVEEVDEP